MSSAGSAVPPGLSRPGATAGRSAASVQATIEELGTPLSEVTFVVVDLETTGGSPEGCGITEIGAVKVRGGRPLGEFQTLVNPGEPIPAFIAVLTGISDLMVAGAPRIGTALPAFLEFARGCVLVAHNAPFDTGFLKAACTATGHPWPDFPVLDTARLARHVLSRDEVRNRKLSTLARLFRSPTAPDHRALTDARATVDVLHGLIERVGNLGVTSLEELTTFTSRVPASTRRKRHLAESLPSAPGVYLFRDDAGRPLYVGVSVDIRARVRSYFTAAEQRTRMAEMVALAASVTPVVCATPLEARVRELRLIAEHAPRYNRRSRFPERAPWLKLTDEPFPRLSVVREVREGGGGAYIGPFGTTGAAELAMAALHEAFPLRQCTRRLPRQAPQSATACLLADLGRCGAPCTGRQSVEAYADVVRAAAQAMTGDARGVVAALLERAERLAGQQRFEEAAVSRDRLLSFVRAASRTQRLHPLATIPELLAALRTPRGGWELVLVRHGRLAGTTVSPPGADPRPYADALRAVGEQVTPPPPPMPAAHPEETEQILRWLEQPQVRLVHLDGDWTCPVHGATGARARLDPDGAAARSWARSFGEPVDWADRAAIVLPHPAQQDAGRPSAGAPPT
ncbi:MAG TPA: DEDD exonuclease domain-containing protein [Kineosporiaceae bacterium]|nr:DEDD exonuclease domain-containing protein [Kineosporiaceae bacterium]